MSGQPAQVQTAEFGAGILAGFSTRLGGVSRAPFDSLNLASDVGDDAVAVHANRAALVATLGVDARHVVWAEQVHAADVGVIEADGASGETTVAGVDALVTAQRGVLLCIRVADCLPVLFADAAAGVVGAAHAGRRGLLAGVLERTVAAMEELGADRERMRAVIGPGICGRCYEVPPELADDVNAIIPGTRARTRNGTTSLDLPAAARLLLGFLHIGSVESVDECTLERPDRWFSYRGAAQTGRFCGYVMLP